MSIYAPLAPRPVKAATGSGVYPLTYDPPLWQASRNPQKLMEQAQALYHTNGWVRLAESAVSGRASNVEWHLEDENDDEVTDESAPALKAIRDLLERPQASLPLDQRQPQAASRRSLWKITKRHMGLCGTSFWFLDQTDALAGVPLSILYLNPARMFPVEDKANGNLLGWTLDRSMEENGTPLKLEQVLPFYFDPPDSGHFGIGLIESIGMKAALSTAVDRHSLRVLGAGGRLTGIIAPKEANAVSDDQWAQFVRDWRGITDDPAASARIQIVKGPVDFTQLAANFQQLAVTELMGKTRDDILNYWGVPLSQVGINIGSGLNSGERPLHDKQILWEGAINDRLTPFWETVQYGLLDRFKNVGITVELVLEREEFDDDTPQYEKAQKSEGITLTRNERRDIIGYPPLPDYDPVSGEPLGIAIDLPINLVLVGAGPSDEKPPQLAQPVTQPLLPAVTAQPVAEPPVKAAVKRPLLHLRQTVDRRIVPAVKKAVSQVLAAQRAEIAAKVRGKTDLAAKRRDQSWWWNPKKWDAALMKALQPQTVAIASLVSEGVQKVMARPAKADFATSVSQRVLTKGAGRVTNINETTRDAVAKLIDEGLDQGMGAAELGDLIENATTFDEYRSELIARTESMFAYNDAALGSYGELGVTEVQAIDGDGDEECAARDGQTFSVEEAASIEDHPNGTLDWIPIEEAPQKAILDRLDTLIGLSQPVPINVTNYVTSPESPDVYVNPAPVTIAEGAVQVVLPPPSRKRLIRDENDRIVGSEEV